MVVLELKKTKQRSTFKIIIMTFKKIILVCLITLLHSLPTPQNWFGSSKKIKGNAPMVTK
jgi:hypothetical protein